MFESRAQQLGLIGLKSPKAMVARSKRTLKKVREQLSALAAPYEDIDSNVQFELDGLIAKFDEFAQYLDDTAKWLGEEAPY